ncbi:MAG: hypothetical protein J6Y64_03355, partial [Ruminococcus sp.]|nr:hypothetical protein [Ruminococcus sp.]
MAVVVIDTIKPKNQGTFPVVEAADVKVTNDKRLDAALNDKASQSDVTALQTAVSGKASQADLNALSSAVSGKASQSDLTALSNTVADKADKSALAETDAAVAGKQAALTEAQIEACNSGITSELAAQITANATAITGKADASDLATLESEVDTKADNSDLATATANLQAQIDNIVTPVTQDAEVQNSRVDAQGVTHTTLKERCDNDDEKHTAYEGNATENLNLLGNELNVEIPLYGRNVSQVATTLYTLVDNVSLSSGVTYRFDFSYERNIETSDYIYAYIKDSSNASVVSWEFPAGSNGGTKTFTPQSNLQNCTIKFMAAVNKYVGEVKVSRA